MNKKFTPLEKSAHFNPEDNIKGVNRGVLPLEDDGGLKPPSTETLRERNSLTGFTISVTILFLLTLGIYLAHLTPALTSDDSGELAGAVVTLGIAHSPGYPLYTLTGNCLQHLVPAANRAYRVNLFAALLAVSGGMLLYFFLYRFSGILFLPFAVVCFILTRPHLTLLAVTTEAYTLNFLAGILFCGLFRAIIPDLLAGPFPTRQIYLLGFLAGFLLSVHYTAVLFIFPTLIFFAVSIWPRFRKEAALRKELFGISLKTLGFFILSSLIFFFLFLRAKSQPIFDWEEPGTWSRFFYVLSRGRYGAFQLAQGEPLRVTPLFLWEQTSFWLRGFFRELGKGGTLLFLASLFFLPRRYRIYYGLLFFFTGPFFLWLARTPLGKSSEELLERFLYLVLVPTGFILGEGGRGLVKKSALAGFVFGLLLLPGIIADSWQVNFRNDFFYYDHGRNILRSLPGRSLLFLDRADETEFVCAYLQRVAGLRQDALLIDCNAGVSRSIYGDDYYYLWGQPRLERRKKKEEVFLRDRRRKVFYATVLPEQLGFNLSQRGLIYATNPTDAPFPAAAIYGLRYKPVFAGQRHWGQYLLYWEMLGKYYLKQGDIDQAKFCFRALIANGGKNWYFPIGVYYQQSGFDTQADEAYGKALLYEPENPHIYTNRGVLAEKYGDWAKAVAFYNQALGIDPDFSLARYNRMVVYWKRRRWVEVIPELKELIRRSPDDARLPMYLQKAETYLAEEDRKRLQATGYKPQAASHRLQDRRKSP